jgi:hypothetical protein
VLITSAQPPTKSFNALILWSAVEEKLKCYDTVTSKTDIDEILKAVGEMKKPALELQKSAKDALQSLIKARSEATKIGKDGDPKRRRKDEGVGAAAQANHPSLGAAFWSGARLGRSKFAIAARQQTSRC